MKTTVDHKFASVDFVLQYNILWNELGDEIIILVQIEIIGIVKLFLNFILLYEIITFFDELFF